MMAVPDWVSYAGLAGGIIGTTTGCMAYWRTGQLKALDLRLELGRADAELRQLILGLSELTGRARRSREAVAAATGKSVSGWLQAWMVPFQVDDKEVFALLGALPPENANNRKAMHPELESALTARHSIRTRAEQLRARYVESLQEDDQMRSEVRAAHLPRANK